MEPLYERLVIVTALPVWANVPFQSWVMLCPLGNENCILQPLIVAVPVLVMVIFTPNPSCHWFINEGEEVDWEKLFPTVFRPQPKRWLIERTFSWIVRWRRFCRDHEGLPGK